MSGIFGIYHSDNRPVDSGHLQKMANSAAHRGPDGIKIVGQPHVGFGHSMLKTTPEAEFEQLPVFDSESGIVLSMDARLDNRHDLSSKLCIKDVSLVPDSYLVLRAYQKWGISCFGHFLGDFAIVLWDSRCQKLICARDYIGVKPFYYHYKRGQFLFSSEIKQLAEHSDVKLIANETMVGEYLSHSHSSKTETLFKDILRLSPGHYLVCQADGITINQYWSWDQKKKLRYKKTSDYTEHFLEIFQESVKSRLRSSGPVSVELSGGLDSSSVVAMAENLVRHSDNKQIRAYSMVFPGHPFDETEYIDAVVKHTGVPTGKIDCGSQDFMEWEQQVLHSFEPPDPPNLTMSDPLITALKSEGSRVILTGIGGDEFFSGSGFPYLDYLQHGQMVLMCKELQYQLKKGSSRALKRFFANIIWPVVPSFARNLLTKPVALGHIPEWLTKDFVERSKLVERIHKADPRLELSNLGSLFHAIIMLNSREQYALEATDKHRAFQQVEVRHPFLDKRMCEFAIAVPDYENRRLGWTKALLREDSNSLLPQKLKERTGKAEFSYFANKAFQQSLFLNEVSAMPMVKRRILNKRKFDVAVNTKKELVGQDIYTSGRKTWELWFAFSVDLWYKTVFD